MYNFIFDTGFITSLVTNRKMCSALRPDHHLQELVLYLIEILNLQSALILTNPSIDRTPLCLHMTSILPAL